MLKTKIIFITLLVAIMACTDLELSPTGGKANLEMSNSKKLSTSSLIVPVDMDPTLKCYTTNIEYDLDDPTQSVFTFTPVECPSSSGGSGQVGSTTNCYVTFPANPTNGQKYHSATGTCISRTYYYSCTGRTWVFPADHLYGTPPSNPYNGLRYVYDYANADATVIYIYLKNTGSNFLPDGWYVDAYAAQSTSCGSTCTTCEPS